MNADLVWDWVLKIGAPIVTLGLVSVTGWWVKTQANKTLVQKALAQLASIMQGLSSDVTSGMTQAVNDATADGVVTAAERAGLIEKLLTLFKSSVTTRFLGTLESVIGLNAGTALDTWLRGIAGDHVDAQLTSASPLKAPAFKVPAAPVAPATRP